MTKKPETIKRLVALAMALSISCLTLAACSGSSQPSSSSSSSATATITAPADSQQPDVPASTEGTMNIVVVFDTSAAMFKADLDGFVDFPEGTEVQIPEGSNVYDALVATGAEVEGDPSYVTSINGLGENEAGSSSGWMYSVNGAEAMVPANEYVLEGGDSVRWYYSVWE